MELFDRLRGKRVLTLAEIEEQADATFEAFLKDAQEAAEKGRPLVEGLGSDPDGSGQPDEYGGLEEQLEFLQEETSGGDSYAFGDTYAQTVISRTGADVPKGSRVRVHVRGL